MINLIILRYIINERKTICYNYLQKVQEHDSYKCDKSTTHDAFFNVSKNYNIRNVERYKSRASLHSRC